MTSAAYPGALDALANPTATTNRDAAGFELDLVIARIQDILEALEAKVGIGASLPSTAGVLRRTAPGATAWGPVVDADVDATAAIGLGKLAQSAAGFRVLATGGSAPAAWQQIAPQMLADSAAWKPIGKIPLTGSMAEAKFTTIPQTFSALRIVAFVRSSVATLTDSAILRVGTGSIDASPQYDEQYLVGNGATAAANGAVGQSYGTIATMPGSSGAITLRFATIDVVIPNYAAAGVTKDWVSTFHAEWSNTLGTQSTGLYGGNWHFTSAIDQLAVYCISGSNFQAGSVVMLYGIP